MVLSVVVGVWNLNCWFVISLCQILLMKLNWTSKMYCYDQSAVLCGVDQT